MTAQKDNRPILMVGEEDLALVHDCLEGARGLSMTEKFALRTLYQRMEQSLKAVAINQETSLQRQSSD